MDARRASLALLAPALLCCLPAIASAQMIVAHRGASYDAPENTLAAFRLAWQKGADGVEGDFHLTRDGHVVCIHDTDTERVAGVARVVKDSTLAELKQLDVGTWKDARFGEERIPTLAEVIATVPRCKKLIIELKVGPEIVAPVKEILQRSSLSDEQIMIISFKEETITEAKRLLPTIKAHWLAAHKQDEQTGQWSPTPSGLLDTLRRSGADGFGGKAQPEAFDRPLIEKLRAGGVDEFHVWTVDDPEMARHYQTLGAYGITTNRPAHIRRHLGPQDHSATAKQQSWDSFPTGGSDSRASRRRPRRRIRASVFCRRARQ